MATSRICSIPDCGKPFHSRGWCEMHYARWRKFGSVLSDKPAKCAKGEAQRYFREVVLAYEGDECTVWPYKRDGCGYGILDQSTVSRRVCAATYGPPPTPEHESAHSCGNGHLGCYTKRHLRWATHLENAADMIRHGRSARGRRGPRTRLTEVDVREIRRLIATHSQGEIGRLFGIRQPHVHQIINRKCWAWLD